MLRVKRSVIAVFSNTYFNTEVLRQATQDSLNSVNQAINKVGSASSEASVGVREEGGGGKDSRALFPFLYVLV